MPDVSLNTFLATLKKSGLLTAAQVDEIERELAQEAADLTSQRLARRLVERKLLTRWQAGVLLSGRAAFFLGKYKLLKELGRGGMGAVFQAEHATLKRVVALKVMAPQFLRDPGAVARFHREIQAAAALDDPHIVAAYDAESVGDTHFLVMEYVAGQTLDELVKGGQSLPIPEACEYIRQAALGLAHAHERGMAHRDIKPANLLLASTPEGDALVKILDMGLARFASESREDDGLTKTGQIMGTPDYIAPEQARNTRHADIRSDIFSLGCTLFRLLTGRVPFEGENVMAKLMARALHDAPRVQSVRSDIPDELDAIVSRMVARDPDRRYQTPAEVATALQAVTTGAGRNAPARVVAASAAGETAASREGLEPLLEVPANTQLDQLLRELAIEATDTTRHIGPRTSADRTISARRKKTASAATLSRNTPRRKLALGLGLSAVFLAGVVAVVFWPRTQKSVISVEWPESERLKGTLSLDGVSRPVPTQGPVELATRPGKRRLELRREGFEPFIEEVLLSNGITRPVRPIWKPTATSQRKQELSELTAAVEKLLQATPADRSDQHDKAIDELWDRVVDFHRRRRGTVDGISAARLLARLPAPADALRRDMIDEQELRIAAEGLRSGAPPQLVTIFGRTPAGDDGSIREPNSPRTCFTMTADGRTLIVGNALGELTCRDIRTGQAVRTFPGPFPPVRVLALSNSGHRLAVATGDNPLNYAPVTIWDFDEGRELYGIKEPPGMVMTIAFAPDDQKLVIGDFAGKFSIHDVRLGVREQVLDMNASPADRREIFSIAFSPDGQTFATVSWIFDRAARIWDWKTKREKFILKGHSHNIYTVAYTPDGRFVVTAGADGTARLWNTATGKEQSFLKGQSEQIAALSISPSGDKIALAGAEGTVSIIKMPEETPAGEISLPATGGIRQIAFTPDGRHLVTANVTGTMYVLRLEARPDTESSAANSAP